MNPSPYFSKYPLALVLWLATVPIGSLAETSDLPTEVSPPDFSGTWHYGTLTPLQRPKDLADKTHFTEEEALTHAREFDTSFRKRAEEFVGEDKFVGADLWLDFGDTVEPDLRTSLIVDPPNGRIPEQSAEAKTKNDRFNTRRMTYSDPEVLRIPERCISERVPIVRAPDNNYVSIIQTKDHFTMVREFAYATRIVPLDRGPLLPNSIKLWGGSSTGYWQGPVLVVITKNFRVDNSPFGGSEELVLTERFSLVEPNRISYEFTVDDPRSFASPWTARSTLYRSDKRRYEYACHEGNIRSMQGILKGSRILEQEASQLSP